MPDLFDLLRIWAYSSMFCLAVMFLYIYSTTIKVYNTICDYHEDTHFDIPKIFQFPSLLRSIAGWPVDTLKLTVMMFVPVLNVIMLIIMSFQRKKTITYFTSRIITSIEVVEHMKTVFAHFDQDDQGPPDYID